MRRWPEALADLNAAARREPGNPETDLLLARLFDDSGWKQKARRHVDAFLAARPRDGRGRSLRARMLAAVGDERGAELDFDAAIAHTAPPDPDLYVHRARLVAGRGAGHRTRALAGLEAGIAILGPAPGLVHLAIEIEMQLGRFDAALERHERLAASGHRKEYTLADRAELLVRAGRFDEARATFEAASEALATLAPARRRTRSALALSHRIDTGLASLSTSSQ